MFVVGGTGHGLRRETLRARVESRSIVKADPPERAGLMYVYCGVVHVSQRVYLYVADGCPVLSITIQAELGLADSWW